MTLRDNVVQPREFVSRLETIFENVIGTRTGGAWDENAITLDIVHELGLLQEISLLLRSDTFARIMLHPYRNKGVAEKKYGDLALIVRIHTPQLRFQGAAFFEAKRSDGTHLRFRKGQPENQLAASGHHFILYYELEHSRSPDTGLRDVPLASRVHSVPSGMILDDREQRPEELSAPFSAQLVNRIFRGYDLDLRPDAVGEALATGARWYLDARIGLHHELTLARRFCEQIKRLDLVSANVMSLWSENESLRELAEERGAIRQSEEILPPERYRGFTR